MSTPAQETMNSTAFERMKMLTMLARMIPIRPMKRKLRQAERSRFVTVPYIERAKNAPPVMNSVEAMEVAVYARRYTEKVTPDNAQ